MANPEHVGILSNGVDAWNEWKRTNAGIRADLRGADLAGMRLRHADLQWADLRHVNLSHSDLSLANLYWADLLNANCRQANLTQADLTQANLTWTNLSGANLTAARLRDSVLVDTIFCDTKLADIQGLDSCHHLGPSSIDLRTLTKNQNLPLRFLRGCGLPDELLQFLPSLIARPIQFYSCFISHSTKDQDFVDRLYADLQNHGVRCWFAPHDVRGGMKLHEQIGEAIRLYDRLLLILSDASMNSEWVKTEIAHARQKELHEGRQVLFPISLVPFSQVRAWSCFDADTGKDSAREIREYFIPDFSNWKDHDSYQKAFQRLVRDLKELNPEH
jgi:hypothetical protein